MSITSYTKKILLYKVLSAALLIATLILCAITSLTFYDAEIGYYRTGALTTVLYIFTAATVLCSIAGIFLFRKKPILTAVENSKCRIISIIPACGFIFFAILNTLNIFSSLKDPKIYIFESLTALIAFAYFFINAIGIDLNKSIKAILGMVSVVPFVLIFAQAYFDYTTSINSPSKLYLMFSAVLFIMYIINEVRYILDKPYYGFYLAVSLSSSLLCSLYGLQKLLCAIIHSISMYELSMAVLFMCGGIYAFFSFILTREKSDIKGTEERA